jgi:hypothetical protein
MPSGGVTTTNLLVFVLTHYLPNNIEKKKKKTRTHQRVPPFYDMTAFLFAHAIGKSQLESISKSLEREGLKPRTHGNTGKTLVRDSSVV